MGEEKHQESAPAAAAPAAPNSKSTDSPLSSAIATLRTTAETAVNTTTKEVTAVEHSIEKSFDDNVQPVLSNAWNGYRDYRRLYPVQMISGATLTAGLFGLPCKFIFAFLSCLSDRVISVGKFAAVRNIILVGALSTALVAPEFLVEISGKNPFHKK
jgi:hypothetical protein